MRFGFAVIAIALAGTTTGVAADSHRSQFKTVLIGYEETPGTINTEGHGTFEMTIVNNDSQINFTLTYANLTGNPLFAHIHFGARSTTGGVSAFLCGGSTKPPTFLSSSSRWIRSARRSSAKPRAGLTRKAATNRLACQSRF